LSGNKTSVAKDSRTKMFDGPADINISRQLSQSQIKYNKIINYKLFVLTFIINKRSILKAI